MKRILVPVDGSESAAHAARVASGLAQAMGASVTLLHVYEPDSPTTLGLTSVTTSDLHAWRQRMAEPHFAAVRPVVASADVTEICEMGAPAPSIVAVAAQIESDLIVMGSRGMSPLRAMLMGSVSDYVVRRAGCPVLVTR